MCSNDKPAPKILKLKTFIFRFQFDNSPTFIDKIIWTAASFGAAERRIAASTFSGKDGIIKRLEAANRNTGERKTVI